MIPRRPGQYLQARLRRIFVEFALTMALCLLLVGFGFVWWPLALLALPILFFVNKAMEGGRRMDPLPWRRGLTGEQAIVDAVGPLLDDGYWILNDIDTGHGNIDHVIAGRNGVFAIETKAWTGNFYPSAGKLFHSDQDATRVVKQAMSGALAIKDRLAREGTPKPWVEALVVSTRSEVKSPKGYMEFGSVRVVAIDRLVDEIRSRRPRLTQQELHRIRATILRWDSGPLRVRAVSQE